MYNSWLGMKFGINSMSIVVRTVKYSMYSSQDDKTEYCSENGEIAQVL